MKNAAQLIDQGVYDLAAFNIQQHVELYLKYRLFLLVEDYPKTHSIKRLLKEIGIATSKEKEIISFMEENIDKS